MEGPPEGSSPIWESNEGLKVDKPPTTDLTNTIELSGTPSSVSGFIAPEVVGRAKSGTPQAFGILAIILAVFGLIISLLALLAIPTELDMANSVGENSTLFVIWTYLEPIIAIIALSSLVMRVSNFTIIRRELYLLVWAHYQSMLFQVL